MRIIALAAALTASPVGAEIIAPDALTHLPPADVIFLGEVHDNPLHHQHQAQAIAAIAPTALVFEMLSDAQASRVSIPLPEETTLARILDWESSGWPDFGMYYPLFAAAPKAAVFGAALPREQARAAMG